MIDLKLLSSALTIVILATVFEIEHCMRLDFFIGKVRLNAKHQIYNNLAMRYTHVGL